MKKIKWNEASEEVKKWYRNLVADYLDETRDRVDPYVEITKDDIKKCWKEASGYFNTDGQIELEFEEEVKNE